MEARLALPKPRNLSLPEAATIGVGVEVRLYNIKVALFQRKRR